MKFCIDGQHRLRGELPVYGAKNCVLALLGATVLTDEDVVLRNCPNISDVQNMLLVLQGLGKKFCWESGDNLRVFGSVCNTTVNQSLANKLRGSALVLGSLVGKCHNAVLPCPGGCSIGQRPLNIHVDGLQTFGVEVTSQEHLHCNGTPQGAKFQLPIASVGATENLVCASVLGKGQFVLSNCATEPEVENLQQMLVAMGAKIGGVGSSTVVVEGVQKLHGVTWQVIPDRIVCATYIASAIASKGQLTVTNCNPTHLRSFLQVLPSPIAVKVYQNAIQVACNDYPSSFGKVTTAPYPGFPTDMQSLLLALACLSNGGTTQITEKMFENRLMHNASQLCKMGAQISVVGQIATVVGGKLHGATVGCGDLRGGASLVVAGLGAQGQTIVTNTHHVLRGYSQLAEALQSVGARIEVQN